MTAKYCIEYTIIEKENPCSLPSKFVKSVIYTRSDYEWYYKENEAKKRVDSLLARADVIKLSLTTKIVLKG